MEANSRDGRGHRGQCDDISSDDLRDGDAILRDHSVGLVERGRGPAETDGGGADWSECDTLRRTCGSCMVCVCVHMCMYVCDAWDIL